MMLLVKGVRLMSDLTLQQAYDRFLNDGSSHWASSTKLYYERNVSYFLGYVTSVLHSPCSSVLVSQLPRDILIQYAVWLRSKSRYSGHPLEGYMNVGGTIKSNTVNTYMRAVKAFFNYLYKTCLVSVRYAENVRLPRPDDDQVVPLMMSEAAAIDRCLDRAVLNDLRNLCIIHLMLDAGLRSCEVVQLQAGDVIFASSTIVINRSKGDKSRAVIMCPYLASLLRDYIDIARPSGVLFTKSTENKPINEAVMKSLFARLRRNTGIDRLHPHLLRHTFATSYIMGGGNLETLRILLGHFDYSVTRKYLHLAAQSQILGMDIYRLDPVFFKTGY